MSALARLRLALLIPLGVLAFAAVVIGGIGLLLLGMAELREEKLMGMKEPLAVIVALLLAVVVLGGAALLARRGSGE